MDVQKKLRKIVNRKSGSLYAFCKQTGMRLSTVASIKNPNLSTICKLAQGLSMHPWKLVQLLLKGDK